MKKYFLVSFILLTLQLTAQQRFYAFAYQGLYGIADHNGAEIIPPTYEWKSYSLPTDGAYLALKSTDDTALLVNTSTGQLEKLTYLSNRILTDSFGEEYLYAIIGNQPFLMNIQDPQQRKPVLKKYVEMWQAGNLHIGYTTPEDQESTADLLSAKDLKIVATNQSFSKLRSYEMAQNGKLLYAMIRKGRTLFFDEAFRKIAEANAALEGYEEAAAFLAERNIFLQESTSAVDVAVIAEGPQYPYISTKRSVQIPGFATFYAAYSDTEDEPFFRLKWNRYDDRRLMVDRFSNTVEIRKPEDDTEIGEVFFHADVVRKKIMLPKKYWTPAGLELLSNENNSQ